MNSETKKLHYANYDKKKSRNKGNKKSFRILAPKHSGSYIAEFSIHQLWETVLSMQEVIHQRT